MRHRRQALLLTFSVGVRRYALAVNRRRDQLRRSCHRCDTRAEKPVHRLESRVGGSAIGRLFARPPHIIRRQPHAESIATPIAQLHVNRHTRIKPTRLPVDPLHAIPRPYDPSAHGHRRPVGQISGREPVEHLLPIPPSRSTPVLELAHMREYARQNRRNQPRSCHCRIVLPGVVKVLSSNQANVLALLLRSPPAQDFDRRTRIT